MKPSCLFTVVAVLSCLPFLAGISGCQPAAPDAPAPASSFPESSDTEEITNALDNLETPTGEPDEPGVPYPSPTGQQLEPTIPPDQPEVAPPTVNGITPNSGLNTETVAIANLAGTGFQTGAGVKFTRSGQPDRPVTNVVVTDGARITGTVDLTGAAAGAWDVVVTNLDGQSATLANGFLVTLPVTVRMPILLYHKVGPMVYDEKWITPAMLRAQLLALKAYGYTPITAKDMMNYLTGASIPPSKPVWITFDDGYESLLTEAYPILSDAAINMKATSFLITGRIGETNAWENLLPVVNYLTWDQVRTLQASGRIDFQSHSVSHPNFTYYPAETLPDELVNSKYDIESRLGTVVNFIAWPYGSDNETITAAAEMAGYFAGFTDVGGVEINSRDQWTMRRIEIDPQISVEYNAAYPEKFFMTQIQEPGFAVPEISVGTIQVVDPATSQVVTTARQGRSIKVQVSATNAGAAADGVATLRIQDAAGSVIYHSHALQPAQDLARKFPPGAQTLEWTCTIPNAAQLGSAKIAVQFHDRYYVLTFADSGWQTGFTIAAP